MPPVSMTHDIMADLLGQAAALMSSKTQGFCLCSTPEVATMRAFSDRCAALGVAPHAQAGVLIAAWVQTQNDPIVTCAICGKAFSVPPSPPPNPSGSFCCSNECLEKAFEQAGDSHA